jgi:uncharacterized protein
MRYIPSQSWFHPQLEIGCSRIHGHGLFCAEPIQAGEVVMVWGGRIFSREDVLSGKAKRNSISGLSAGLYLGQAIGDPDNPDEFLNHSCDPNLWMIDEITLVARRPIAVGSEITADYALWEFDDDWILKPCACGTFLCRKVITGRDWRSKEVQKRYKDHFLPWINQQILALKGLPESALSAIERWSE